MTQLPISHARAKLAPGLLTARTLNPWEYTDRFSGDTSLTSTRENRHPFWPRAAVRRQRLVDGALVNELGSCTVTVNWKASRTTWKSGCRTNVEAGWRSGHRRRQSGHPRRPSEHVGRRRSTERRRRARYDKTPVQNDEAVWDDEADAPQVSDTVAESSNQPSPPGQLAVSPSRRRRRGCAPLRCYCCSVQGNCFSFMFLPPSVATPFRYSAIVPRRFTVTLGQIAL